MTKPPIPLKDLTLQFADIGELHVFAKMVGERAFLVEKQNLTLFGCFTDAEIELAKLAYNADILK